MALYLRTSSLTAPKDDFKLRAVEQLNAEWHRPKYDVPDLVRTGRLWTSTLPKPHGAPQEKLTPLIRLNGSFEQVIASLSDEDDAWIGALICDEEDYESDPRANYSALELHGFCRPQEATAAFAPFLGRSKREDGYWRFSEPEIVKLGEPITLSEI